MEVPFDRRPVKRTTDAMAKKTAKIASRTTLKREPKSGELALIVVPGDVRGVFGEARPAVRATLGKYTFRTTVAVYGGKSYVGVRRSRRGRASSSSSTTRRAR